MSEQSRRKLGAIGRSTTHSQSFDISPFPREDVITCAEYPNPFPNRFNSRRYHGAPSSTGGKDGVNELFKQEYTIPEIPVSGGSDSTPLLRLSSLSSQYHINTFGESPPLDSHSVSAAEDSYISSPVSLHHQQTLKVHNHLNSDNRSIGRLSPGDTSTTCECHRSPMVLSRVNSNESLNFYDPGQLSIENRTLSKYSLKDANKLKFGSMGNLDNSRSFSTNFHTPALQNDFAASRAISKSLGGRGIVGAAGLGIGIGTGPAGFFPEAAFGNIGREFPATRSAQSMLNLGAVDATNREERPLLSRIGWWILRGLLYTFYLGLLIAVLTYTYFAIRSKVAITVFLVVLSVVLVVFILFCVCFIVYV